MEKILIRMRQLHKKYPGKSYVELPPVVQLELLEMLASERGSTFKDATAFIKILRKASKARQTKASKEFLDELNSGVSKTCLEKMQELWEEGKKDVDA